MFKVTRGFMFSAFGCRVFVLHLVFGDILRDWLMNSGGGECGVEAKCLFNLE